jgi:site-specific recombinase XerD
MLNKPRLLDQVRDRIRVKHYSLRTEQAYIQWIKRFIFFHGKRHPKGMAEPDVEAFLSHLATEKNVSASTPSQALSALRFLYREGPGIEFPWLEDLTRAKKPQHLPVVLTVAEVKAVLVRLEGRNALLGNLLYGAGLRLMEVLRPRVKDLDFGMRPITVRDGKGFKDH